MSSLRTTLSIGSGLYDYEIEVVIDYSVSPGFAGSYHQPPEPASAEILAVAVIDSHGKSHPAPWLCDLLADDEEMLSLCLVDDDERAEYAAEQRADAKREAMMLGDDR